MSWHDENGMASLGSRHGVDVRPPQRILDDLVLPRTCTDAIKAFMTEWPQRDRLRRYGIPSRSTVLLYGPPGNGKTAIAECIASGLKLPFGVVELGRMQSKYVGETGENLHRTFQWAARNPLVLLFDECDSLLSERMGSGLASQEMSRIVNVILKALDAREQSSVFVFATNRDDALDPAFLRRINLKLLIDTPSSTAKETLISRLLRRWPFIAQHSPDGIWRELAMRAPNFAECEQVVMNEARALIISNKVS